VRLLHALQRALEATPLAAPVRDLVWVKAVLESAHILADALIIASLALVCGRLLGKGPFDQSLADWARRSGPWVWGGLAVAVVTGLVLLSGAGRRGLDNPMFTVKLAAMAAAALCTAGLQAGLMRAQPGGRSAVLAVAAPLCLMLWFATAFAGRLLAYAGAFFPRY
jgi:hypothetical protein